MIPFKPYLDLCRVSNLPTVWTNVLAGSVLAAGFAWGPYLLLAVALSCFYLAGMSFNDVCDVEHDRRHRPDRPIPSGRVSLAAARRLTVALFAVGFMLLAMAPDPAGLGAGALLLLAIVAYDLRHKGNPLSVLVMASCRFLVYLVVALALTGTVEAFVLTAAALQFFYVLAISLVGRHESSRAAPFQFPVIPAMLAGIALLDGLILAVLVAPVWLLAGLAGSLLTWIGQRLVRGD
jgi:4-hydroxybenzoate polyprenyltransferase